MQSNLLPKELIGLSSLKEVLKSIEDLRMKIDDMTENSSLTDPELMYASRMLDGVLYEYQEIMKEKMNRS